MKKFLAIAIMLFCAAALPAFAQMTDSQVVEYVKSAAKSGKSQTEISRELIAKGVTMDQVNRLKAQYNNGTLGEGTSQSGGASVQEENARQTRKPTSDRSGMMQAGIMPEAGAEADGMPMAYPGHAPASVRDTSVIFGHDIFRPREDGISFEPNENIATPENYTLGPGDELIIDIWGSSEDSIRQKISPEGRISIPQLGPVYLNGLSVKEASAKIKRSLSAKFSGLSDGSTNVSVALGEIRTIQVNVMGDVDYPGAYRLSAFSTVFSALYAAGGISETGSLRDIQVIRNGEKVATADIYAYIFDAKTMSDVRLQDGDVIVVPAYVNVVYALGGVKRPMKYEMAAGETVADLLKYSGGFTGRAFDDNVSVLRNSGKDRQILTATKESGYNVALNDGDMVTVGVSPQHFANRLEIKGYVVNPGEYEFGGEITTVKTLVNAAGGLKEDAFVSRAVLQRETEDMSYEMLSVDLGGIMKGTRPDVSLRKGDVLTVAGIHELNDRGTLTINGMVANPGTFDFAENTTVEDLIILAGGLLDGASMAKVDVSRRITDPYSLEVKETIGESFSFSIKDGLAVDGADSFYLKPYDVVSVRKSPAYQAQQFVTVSGEVAFPGEYVLQSNGERISSVIQRAGGLTYLAFIKGGKLTRRMTPDEIKTAQTTMETERRNLQRQKEKLALQQGTDAELDENDLEALEVNSTYTVAVDFESAIANPGGDADIILREGDLLTIPENIGTVAVKGEVLYPNTVAFVSGKKLDYYVSQAGGYNTEAKKAKVYVVYMNGSVAKGSNAEIQPGCEIVVPRRPERKGLSATEILSLGTSTASLSAMIISLVNLLK